MKSENIPPVIFWPHTNNVNVASFRIRCKDVCDGLVDAGLDAKIANSASKPGNNSRSVLIVSKRLDFSSLATAVEYKRQHGTKIVLDACDNIFPNTGAKRQAADERIELLQQFDAIVTPSGYLGDLFQTHVADAPRCEVIHDIAEQFDSAGLSGKLRYLRPFLRSKKTQWQLERSGVSPGRRLLWFGVDSIAHGSGLVDLERIKGTLEEHNRKAPLSLTVLSNNRKHFNELFKDTRFTTYYQKWHFSTFGMLARLHDVALIPITANEFTNSKSANRMTTSFMLGLGVVASEIPSYVPFRDAAVLDDWGDGLAMLMDSHAIREEKNLLARSIIEASYSKESVVKNWVALLESLE